MLRSHFLGLVAACAAAAALTLAACSVLTASPSAAQVTQIQLACNADAALRPTIDVLLDVPGLATAAERDAVAGARLVIDPICDNPASSPASNALVTFTEATGKITQLVVQLQARQARQTPPVAPVGPEPAASAA